MSDALACARELIATLREQLSTIILGTAAPDGAPEASVAATLLDADGAFVIYVSGLAAHTRHLRANPRASVLLIEPETTPGNPLARPPPHLRLHRRAGRARLHHPRRARLRLSP